MRFIAAYAKAIRIAFSRQTAAHLRFRASHSAWRRRYRSGASTEYRPCFHRARLVRARPAGVLVALGLAACSPAPNSKPEVWKPPAYAKPVREPEPVRTLTVYGVGNSSCGTWTQDRATAANAKANAKSDPMDRVSALTDETWVIGFVSGYSHGASLKDTDSVALAAFMDNYCQVHPLDTIATAAAALVRDLAQQ